MFVQLSYWSQSQAKLIIVFIFLTPHFLKIPFMKKFSKGFFATRFSLIFFSCNFYSFQDMLLPVTKLSYTCHSLSLWSKKSPQDFLLNHSHSVFFCCGKILSVTSTQKILSVTSKQKNRCNCSSVNLKTRRLDKINQFGLDDYFLNFSHWHDQICIIPGVLHRNLS